MANALSQGLGSCSLPRRGPSPTGDPRQWHLGESGSERSSLM